MQAIHQRRTYRGLLEGLPTRKMNARHIAQAVRLTQEEWRTATYLIDPPEELIEEGRSVFSDITAAIPAITCSAIFSCHQVARDPSMFVSELAIVWFQPSFALPIEESVLQQIRSIDWEKHAQDLDY